MSLLPFPEHIGTKTEAADIAGAAVVVGTAGTLGTEIGAGIELAGQIRRYAPAR